MFNHDDNVKDFNNYGGIKYKSPTEINETYVRVNKISKSLLDELNAYLKAQWDERGEYAPSADIVKRNGGDAIYFDIVWGDWKHDHMRLWHLMNKFFRERGYVIERDMEVTDEDGSDTFSAEHYYTVSGDDENETVKTAHINESYVSKETSHEIASEIAQLAKRALRLPAHEVEMLEHDINNLRANEWVDTFSRLSDKSRVKQLFFKYAVKPDEDDICESYLDDVKAYNVAQIEKKAGEACSSMGNLISALNNDTKDAWEAQISPEDIDAMRHASDAAWLLYHYRKDGKVRPIKR